VEETGACDGSSAPVMAALSCSWPMSSLSSTYSYATGDLVSFAARAYNSDGWGAYSNPNTAGATIMTLPAAMGTPIEGALTSYTQIQATWSALASVNAQGGTPITSYSLEWDQGSGTFVVLKGDPA
jgi:hypothetical protein